MSVEEAQKIQDIIGVHTFADPLPMVVKAKRYPLGFFLGFTRGVIAKELPGGRILPSTSYYIILHQEEYFRRRYPMGVGESCVHMHATVHYYAMSHCRS